MSLAVLSRDKIHELIEKYDYDRSIEKELGEQFRLTKQMNKEELTRIIRWKFRGRLA